MVIPFLHRWPRFKPFSDVYASLYRDDRRWWSGVDLFRRLLLAAVYTSEVDSYKQQLGTLLCCVLLLTVHTLAWPFRHWRHNAIETLLLTALVSIAALSGPDMTWSRAFAIQWLFFVPLGLVIIYHIYRVFPKFSEKAQMEVSERFGVELDAF